jgi:long-subunit fatty acid transport protein
MRSLKSKLAILSLIASIAQFSSLDTKAQFIEDALRFSTPNGFAGARSMSLGVSYLGVADDISTLFSNPAGLSILPKTEISVGLSFLRDKTETSAFNASTNFKSNNGTFNNIGIAAPFNFGERLDKRGAIAIAYYKENNFHSDYETDWFNSQNSMSNFLATNYPTIANHVWLSSDQNPSKTPVIDSLFQYSSVSQSGGIHNISGGASFDINRGVALGFAITGKWGTYEYDRFFKETDGKNIYRENSSDFSTSNFSKLTINEHLSQDISGISGSVGLLARIGDNIRFGVSVRFPSYYEITDISSYKAKTEFDDDFSPNPYTYSDLKTSYKVTTPFVYSGGMSFFANGLVCSAGIEYSDASQLEFSDASDDASGSGKEQMDYLNRMIVKELVGQVTWGFGAEYNFPNFPVAVRASYSSISSPYSTELSGASRKIIGLGAGVSLGAGVRLDAALRFQDYTEYRTLYGSDIASRFSINSQPIDFALNLSIRI